MLKRENSLFNEYKENLYRLNNIGSPNTYRSKIHKISELNTNFYNNDNTYNIKKNKINNNKMNDTMRPLNREKNKIIEIKKNDLIYGINNNKSFNKIIQKEIFLNNNINFNSSIIKEKNIKNIPINTNNNYFINFNNSQNDAKNQNDNKIKNIRISLKKIKLGNLRALSKNQNKSIKDKYNETYIYKSPKRKRSLNTERSLLNREISETNNSYIYSKLLSKINISPKKNNLIPKPNIKHENIRKNLLSDNIIIGKKKIDKKLLDQSKEIKMKFKKENEIIKMKNEFFYKNGILPEQKIDYENKAIKIQSLFRRFLSKKKLYRLKNQFFILKISKVNNIIINNEKKENSINDKICLISRKYILKYLLFKKEQKKYNIIKIFFDKFKSKTLNNYKKKLELNDIKANNNILKIKVMKIKDIISKKIKENKQSFFKYFLNFYYKNYFIDFNLCINIINKLVFIQKFDSYNNSLIFNKNNKIKYSKYIYLENLQKIPAISNINKQYSPSLLSFINNAKKLMKKLNETNSKELKKFYLRDIIKSINNIDNEQEIMENSKKLKAFTIILFSKIKNFLNDNYSFFYYKFLFILKERNILNKIKPSINLIEDKVDNKQSNMINCMIKNV